MGARRRWRPLVLPGCLVAAVVALALPLTAQVPAVQGDDGLPAGYARALRPNPGGPPTEVKVGVYVLDVIAIDGVSHQFTADLFVSLSWHDPRLALPPGSDAPEERLFAPTEIWVPRLIIMNQRSLDRELAETVQVDRAGNVRAQRRLHGAFSTRFDLRDFPFDSQLLQVVGLVTGVSPDQVSLVADPESSGMIDEVTLTGWDTQLLGIESDTFTPPGIDRERSRLVLTIRATRLSSYYRWTMIVPLSLIVLMAWTVFWIDPSMVPPQISVSTASVFTLIAFRFSMRFLLPEVHYMTRFDKFVTAATFLVFLSLAQVVVTSHLMNRGKEATARTLDRWGRWSYLVAFVAVLIVTLGT